MSRFVVSFLSPLLVMGLVLAAPAFGEETPKTLLVGVYDSETGADDVYDELKKVEKANAIDIGAFALVSKDEKGKVSVYNTRQKDSRWGAVVGGVIGLLTMGPLGAVGGAGAGAGAGWLIGNAAGISKENIKNVESALEPNTSALIAVVDNKWVADIEKAIKKKATNVYIKDELKLQRMAEQLEEKSTTPSTTH